MELPKMDGRTKEDLIRYMKKYLSSYAPEWRFDEEHPDVGTALSFIYADMMSETIYRFNQVSEKNRVLFFNKIGAKLLPAVPASGYITFSLVNEEAEGVAVKRGEAVLADLEDGESLVFETLNDVYVTSAKPDCLYLCSREEDLIGKLFEKDGEDSSMPSCTLFDLQGANLQSHEFYFSHPSILNMKSEGWIQCSFYRASQRPVPEEFLDEFMKEDNVGFEYYSSEGFVPFEERAILFGQLALKKGPNQPAFAIGEHEGAESFWVRCKVKDVRPFRSFSISRMAIRSAGQKILPDAVNAKGVEQKVREFFPFGERPSLYDEVYFMSDEVFGKKGASITLDFDLDFFKLPLEVQEIENEINWKAIMRRSEVKADIEYDISIAEVIWEYYNGEGFARLFVNEQFSDVFGIQEGTSRRRVSIHFQCPADLEPVLVNSSTSCCIRARILKMNNLYKMKGNYISPLVSNPRMRYEYIQDDLVPEAFFAANNLDTVSFTGYEMGLNTAEFAPLEERGEQMPTLYLGFEKPLAGGPIKMLFSMEENLPKPMPLLHFEYSTERGWKTLNVIDETENFRKTGIITMMGSRDFSKRRLLGKERCWIRITDANNSYGRMKGEQLLPRLNGIYMNTTQVNAVETKEPEYFTISPNEENKECRLKNGQVCEIHVWVNEYKTIHRDELPQLERDHAIRYDHAPDGELEAVWVEWKEVEQFEENGAECRCYQVDRIDGTVVFPNGRNGKIPASDENPTICIEYSCGGGSMGNLPKHSLRKLNRNIGFISDVDNHEITTGGLGQEQVKEALDRNAAAIRHGYRAVTASDYEALAREATRNICKVKCFSNRNEAGEREYGHITLVVLQKDYERGRKHFDLVRAQIMDDMKKRMSSQLFWQNRFHVIEPDFLELSVTVTLQVLEYNQVFDVRKAVESRLEEFLNPVTGNYYQNGWEIGTIPNTTQILNALKEIPGIHYIENVRLTACQRGQRGNVEVDIDKIRKKIYALPISGSHEIIIKIKK